LYPQDLFLLVACALSQFSHRSSQEAPQRSLRQHVFLSICIIMDDL
jgi:hypothetical protein